MSQNKQTRGSLHKGCLGEVSAVGRAPVQEGSFYWGRGRPRKTLEETLRKDLEYLDLTEDLTQNRAQWRSRIHIADPT
ncbi:hypothetical protein DVH24_000065 [Malus domestica]|uniref:Uncharacterized protein n=1 Tax=Malus domestica TaxID=3750 RepID=A0A498IZG8_MALDO|nr:hypothetical protein DVH24_000065 [Malus domestica]